MNFLFGLRVCSHDVPIPESPPASHAPPTCPDNGPTRGPWAVRRDWPDGTHEFVGLETERVAAETVAARLAIKMRPLPYRPRNSVVPISTHDFWLHAHHRQGCKAPDCPVEGDMVAA